MPTLKSLPGRSPDLARVRGDFDGDGMADLTAYRPHTASWHTIGIKSGQPLPTVNHRVARDRANISGQPAAQPIAATARPSDMFMVGLRKASSGVSPIQP